MQSIQDIAQKSHLHISVVQSFLLHFRYTHTHEHGARENRIWPRIVRRLFIVETYNLCTALVLITSPRWVVVFVIAAAAAYGVGITTSDVECNHWKFWNKQEDKLAGNSSSSIYNDCWRRRWTTTASVQRTVHKKFNQKWKMKIKYASAKTICYWFELNVTVKHPMSRTSGHSTPSASPSLVLYLLCAFACVRVYSLLFSSFFCPRRMIQSIESPCKWF